MTDFLVAENLTAGYGETTVLRDVSFSVPKGGAVAILGANGAGKTTLLRAICGMIKRSGRISFDGRRIDTLNTPEIVRLGLAHVPDGRGTFLHLTVEENLRLGAYTRRDRKGVQEDTALMYKLFPPLKERRHQMAVNLSGGEQQMLAVSRALMSCPRLLLLDEPSFGLAPLVVREIFTVFRSARSERDVAILLVEQNTNIALELADYAYLIEMGKVILSGSAAQMRANDSVSRSYLGVSRR